MAKSSLETSARLLHKVERAAAASGAPACEVLVDVGKRVLARGTDEAAAEAAFVAGRAFECVSRVSARLGGTRHDREDAARALRAALRTQASALARDQLRAARARLAQVEHMSAKARRRESF